MKVKLLNVNGQTKNYVLILSKGDEVSFGLTEFAQKYNVRNAHFTVIGEPFEVSSMIGNIATFNGNPAVHIHANVSTSDNISHGGYLLELLVGLH